MPLTSEHSAPEAAGSPSFLAFVKRERVLGIAVVTSIIAFLFEDRLFHDMGHPVKLTFLLAWLFSVILASAVGVVRHAEAISERLGEPFGTLVLTLSITGIEVLSITAVMLNGENNPALVRDTLFSVVMIIMGGMLGISLLLGALRHRELTFNLQGANAYLGVIIPLAVFSLILPNFTRSTEGPTLSDLQKVMLGLMAAGLYLIFLMMQTGRHRGYFAQPEEDGAPTEEHKKPSGPLWLSVILLFCYILPVVYLVEQLAKPIDYIIETRGAPGVIGGVLMAILVTTPEGIGGVRAALNKRLQSSVNIFLGSVLATIGLTVPIMLAVSSALGLNLQLGLAPTDALLLVLILVVSIVTFSSGRTNLLQGAVHFLLFVAFLLLIYRG
ncbi:MAG: calcium:proton antiporter [Martelella sp.]|uniref:calcium:proton antiporter n=1 Tax=unclassified Martelella TaxID=2629616 RepID=UPI000C3995EB|nr:calcium:proton antiporter [Martelella sp.]MAU19600.1 calcium:proton antiporter [Martelella sp.]|tara:strand:- start:208 stop:1359 length:1152 start_codon:yes stop_codon:yes gene_type:complete